MKHTFRACLVCLLLVVFCCLTVCGAGDDYFVSYPGGDSDIVIKGTAGVEKANRQITLQVIREGISVSSAAETDVLYMRQVMTDVNGDFSFTFTIADRGEHSIRISDSGTLLIGQPVFYRSTEDELSDAVAKLNAALNNADAMDMVISGNSGIAPNVSMMKVLQIDSAGYASLKTDTSFLRNLASKTYESVPEFMSQYELAKLLVELSRAANGNTVKTLLAESDNAITFEGKHAGLTFAGYNESDKNAVYETMATKNYSSVADVQNALYEAVIVKDIAAANTYQAKFSVIEHNNDVLGLDMTKCTSLGAYVEGFKSELASQPLNSLSSIRTSFDTLYLKHLEIKNNAENRGSSGSSGGVGGGGPTYIEVGKEPITSTPSYYFNDIDSVAWAKDAIEALAAKGVIAGKAKNIFAPYDSITRAEFAKILFGAFGLIDDNATTEFIDVPESHWAYKYVATAYNKGIVNGIGDGMFGADSAITRQDIVTLCYRLTEHLGITLPQANGESFTDSADIASYASVAADKMKAAGIVNGKGDNRFDPKAPATRAEATKIIYGLMQYCQK